MNKWHRVCFLFFVKLKTIIQVIGLITICSCGTQNNNMSKPSAGLTISPAATTLLDVISGKFPGITVIGDNMANGNPKILIRGGSLSINNQAYAIFDIDGSIQTDFPSYIDPQQIKSISILKSLAATNRYGGIARGGAIVIRLKKWNIY
mgnify:FL=1